MWLAVAAVSLLIVGTLVVIVHGEGRDGSSVSTDGGDDDAPSPTTSTRPETTTTAAPSTSTSVPSNVLPGPGAAGSIVVGVDGVLGWWDGTGWVQASGDLPPFAVDGQDYQILYLDQPITTVPGRFSASPCDLDDSIPTIDVGLEVPHGNRPLPVPVALTGVANPRPRPVALLDPGAAAYRSAAADVLTGLGVTDAEPTVVQVVESDLDGDGVDEVLVTAEVTLTPEGPSAFPPEPGEYSFTFLRRIVAGDVMTTVVDEWVTRASVYPFVAVSQVVAVADFNGDDRMEFALDWGYYEGRGTSLYELLPDGRAVQVLEAVCGL